MIFLQKKKTNKKKPKQEKKKTILIMWKGSSGIPGTSVRVCSAHMFGVTAMNDLVWSP